MQNRELNVRQAGFMRLYLGRDRRYRGNATRSYMKAYDVTDERIAQSAGSRLANNPIIAGHIEKAFQKELNNLGIDAGFVLEQSVRLYDRAMADEAVEIDVINVVDGVHVPTSVQERRYDPQVAKASLELIGRHTSVQAFQDNVEHNHTHRLEQRLAARSKQVEEKAAQRSIIDGTAQEIIEVESTGHRGGQESEKEGASGGRSNEGTNAPGKTSSERVGATGE